MHDRLADQSQFAASRLVFMAPDCFAQWTAPGKQHGIFQSCDAVANGKLGLQFPRVVIVVPLHFR